MTAVAADAHGRARTMLGTTSMVRLMPHHYLHVEDTNTCEVFTLIGPITYTLRDHHRALQQTPQPFVVVPPGHYVTVTHPMRPVTPPSPAATTAATANSTAGAATAAAAAAAEPVCVVVRSAPRSATGMVFESYSRGGTPYGSSEVRGADASPFPLLPGETVDTPAAMPLLTATEALVLEALAPHEVLDRVTGATRMRAAQERYLFAGPGLYTPRLDERVVEKVQGVCMTAKQVGYVTAMHSFTDDGGVARVAGETWMLRATGIRFAHPATTLQVWNVHVLPTDAALVFVSSETFVDDVLKVTRAAQRPYQITRADTADGTYAARPHETLQTTNQRIVLTAAQYCVTLRHDSRTDTTNDGAAAAAADAADAADAAGAVGQPEVRVGKQSFLLEPVEHATGTLDVLIVKEDEALLLTALFTYTEADGTVREGGSRWLVTGPCRYVPPVYARVVERRQRIVLHENCGVYVRNINTGAVRSVFGKPFMPQADERLWRRPVSAFVRRLLAEPRQSLRVADMSPEERAEASLEEGRATAWVMKSGERCASPHEGEDGAGSAAVSEAPAYSEDAWEGDEDGDVDEAPGETGGGVAATEPVDLLDVAARNACPPRLSRDITPYHVITANVEHNTLMRLYDTSTGRSRVVAGPATVFLEPHEHFTPLSLSAGRPKVPHQIHSLSLYLGPDYMADVIEVETRDHARLRLHLAYNWEFGGVAEEGQAKAAATVDPERAFTIPDFIGEACKALASRVRSAIAGHTFEFLHCNSSTLIRQSIFAPAQDGAVVSRGDALCFTANGLYITTVDVQSVEPVDIKTRAALTKSVQLAVEIITKAQESDASHQAALLEQEARGALDLQVMRDRAKAEEQRTQLLQVMGDNTVLEQAGASRAQALAESAARLAEAQGEVDATPIRCAANTAGMDAELAVLRQRAELDLAHRRAMNELAVDRVRRLAEVEAAKYEAIMAALGKETLIAIANAGPELKGQLLGALGLEGFVVTDGTTPINMLTLADQMAATGSA